MSLPLTPLVTDIQWPPWLKMGPAPKKRNGQSTWRLPMHMGGVRQAARCPYGAAEPPWAMVRCYSSSHSPILYTSCVGLLQLLTHNYLGHSARIARNRSTRILPSLPARGDSGAIKPLYCVLRLPEFRFTYVQQGVQQNAQSDHAVMHVPQSQSG